MDDKIQAYRQSMVYATGILLGFSLNTAAGWVGRAFSTDRFAEFIISISICIHIPLYIVVLFRALNMNYPKEKAESYYRKTLFLFITGIIISFLSIAIIAVESAIIHSKHE
jgi:uncharacterized membrane protein